MAAGDLSFRDAALLERAANNDVDQLVQNLADAFKKGEQDGKNASRRSSRGGGSWLQKIANALAQALDSKIEQMDNLANKLDKQGKDKSVSASTDLQVAGQEFSYMMQTTNTVIKTIGEGLSAVARKQ